jgi:hypothetical protein
MIPIKTLLKGIGKVAQEIVGSHLSQTNGQPSVYIARKVHPYENYPFIIIDKIAGGNTAGWGLDRWVDDNDAMNYENTYNYILSVQIYDKADRYESDSASDVLNKLRDYMIQVPSVRRKIKEYSTATLEDVYEVTDRTFATKDGYVKSYGFNLSLVGTSVITEAEDYINTLNLDVELLEDEDDPTPLTITIEQSFIP